MATISAQEFLKGGKPQLVAPASDSAVNTPSAPEKPGFFQRAGEDLKKRGSSIVQTVKDTATGKINIGEAGVQTVGSVAGGINDVTGEAIKGVVNALPNQIKDPVKQGAVYILQTKAGQAGLEAIGHGMEKYAAWRSENPQIAKDLESVLNIAALLPVGKGGQVVKEGLDQAGIKAAELGAETANQAGKGLIKVGEKIQDVVLKPSLADVKNGFKMENVTKYGLNGPLGEMAPKTTEMLTGLRTQLSETIKNMGQEPSINLKDALDKLGSDFKSKGLKNLGSKTSIDNTIETIQKELDQILPSWRKESVSFSDAVDAKRAAGLNSAFLHGQIPQGLTAADRVWNDLYKILQHETERAAEGTPFKDLNTKISELIPIEQAIIRRIPVADRNNLLSLPDIIAGVATVSNPKALTVGILNHALKSGFVAKNLVKAGKFLIKK